MKRIILVALLFRMVEYAYTQNAPPPQANVQYTPYVLNQVEKDVVVSDMNFAGDVTGYIQPNLRSTQAFIYKNSGPISERWILFAGDSINPTKGVYISYRQSIVGNRRSPRQGIQGMHWWPESSGYRNGIVDIDNGNLNVKDYELLRIEDFRTTSSAFQLFGNATVMKQVRPSMTSSQTEIKAVKQAFYKSLTNFGWLPAPVVNGVALESFEISGKTAFGHKIGGSALNLQTNRRWAAYWLYESSPDHNSLDNWRVTVIRTDNDSHSNAIAGFGNVNEIVGVGYNLAGGSHAWLFNFQANTHNSLKELATSDISEALDCANVKNAGLSYDFIAVGYSGEKAVKWEINSASGMGSQKVVDLNTVVNQRLYPGLILKNALVVNYDGKILCQGELNGRKVGVLLTPR